jgi:pre-mRNA-splicing factor RBM22/SLT11
LRSNRKNCPLEVLSFAMAASSSAGKGGSIDPRKAGVEASEFPILCETCLGPNPYVRMLQDKWGRPCKVCERPFTVFRWKPAGAGTRYKNTQVCQTCARVKNVCQTCVLDLAYGLPVQVRDSAMAPADRQLAVVPSSDGAKQYVAAQCDRAIAEGKVDAAYAAPKLNSIAEKAKRTAPRYERNRAQLCTWFAKGKCARGVYCQYRHELPKDKSHPMSNQNIQDRYYGVNDPVAASILARTASVVKPQRPRGGQPGGRQGPPPVPDDESIKSLFIGGVTAAITEPVLRALFDRHESSIASIRVLPDKSIAFIDFVSREASEAAIAYKNGRIEIADTNLSIGWARSGASRDTRRAEPASSLPSFAAPAAPLVSMAGLVPGVQAPPPYVAHQSPAQAPPPASDARPSESGVPPPAAANVATHEPAREYGEPAAKRRRED